MKRIPFVLAASLMALSLVGCGESKPTVSEAAVEALGQISYTDEATTGVTGDFALSVTSEAEGYDFTLTYTAGDLIAYPDGYTFISISEDGATAKVTAPNFLDKTLDFKNQYGTFAQCYIEATLNYEGSPVKDPADASKNYSKKFNIRINATSACKIADLYTADLLKAGVAVEFDGYFLSCYNPEDPYNGVFVADGDAGVELYGLSTLPSGLKAGDPVHVTGMTSPYSGLVEIAKPLTMKIITAEAATASGIAAPVTIEYTDTYEFKYQNLCTKIHVTGKVKATPEWSVVAGRTQGTGYVIVGTKEIAVRVDSKYAGDTITAAAKTKLVKDAQVDLTGILGYYSSADSFTASGIQVLAPVFAE